MIASKMEFDIATQAILHLADGRILQSTRSLKRHVFVGRGRAMTFPTQLRPLAPEQDLPATRDAPFDQLRFLARLAIEDLRGVEAVSLDEVRRR